MLRRITPIALVLPKWLILLVRWRCLESRQGTGK